MNFLGGVGIPRSTNQTNDNEVDGIKFKNKKDWTSESWSSQNFSSSSKVNNIIFDENDEGNIIFWDRIDFNNSPELRYYITIDNKVGFMPEAFIEEDQYKINEFITSNKIEEDISDSEEDISSKKLSAYLKPDDLENDILIIGDTNHEKNAELIFQLRDIYKDKGAYIFGESFTKDEQTNNLDDYISSFRADILFASLYTKHLKGTKKNDQITLLQDKVLQKKLNMVSSILENEREPNIVELRDGWNNVKKNENKVTFSLIEPLFEIVDKLQFNFLEIYTYYFDTNDPYYNVMRDLLSLSNDGGLFLNILGAKDPINGEKFKIITQEAREMHMVKRIRDYMNQENRRKVVIFTGIRHVNFLEKELLRSYTVKRKSI